MSAVKNFWFYAVLFITAVLLVLGLAIWTSATPATSLKKTPVDEKPLSLVSKATNELSVAPSAEPVPNDFPAPAKKLHQVINAADTGNAEIDQKIEQLDQQLAILKQELEAKGITEESFKDQSKQPALKNADDIRARLESIKEHMKNKNN